MAAAKLFANIPLDGLSPELLRAALWIESHPREVALHSMRECARRAVLAPSTLTRLSRALGFTGFEAIKSLCQESFALEAGYAGRAEALQASAQLQENWLAGLNEAQHANTASILGLNTASQLEAAADAMLAANHIYFLGLRASHGLAMYLHYTFGLLAPNGVLVQGMGGTLNDQIGEMGRGDLMVAISFAPYTRQTVETVTQALRQEATLLVLTDSALSPIARSADHTLLFRAESSSYFHSMVGALTLGEALLAAAAVRGGRKVLTRLQSRQNLLDSTGAYWNTLNDKRAATPSIPSSSRK
jgi:DNA-binding MurR/RpiR family transcriptional regulator